MFYSIHFQRSRSCEHNSDREYTVCFKEGIAEVLGSLEEWTVAEDEEEAAESFEVYHFPMAVDLPTGAIAPQLSKR
jgi:hypothetical protein